MVAHSSEFENIVVREEEQNELEELARSCCPLEVKGGPSNKHGKISILIQVIDLSYTFLQQLIVVDVNSYFILLADIHISRLN